MYLTGQFIVTFHIIYKIYKCVSGRSWESHELEVRIRYVTRDEVGVTVRYWVCNRELTVSKARKTTYCLSVRSFTHALHVNAGIIPRLGHDSFLPNPFPILHQSTMLPFDTTLSWDSDSVLK
jgi:hypothetical protein